MPLPARRVAMLALAVLLLPACGDSREAKAKHVVFISVDTLRYDRLGCYGGPNSPSPAIDALAASGTRFRHAYVSRAITLTSFTSFFTSKYPDETGILNNRHVVGESEFTLAERLAKEEFHCVAFQASSVLAPRSRIDQGFIKYQMETDEARMTARACEFVRTNFAKDRRREFIWVHFMRPHKPYLPPPPYDTKFDPNYTGKYDASSKTLDRIFEEKEDLAPADLNHILALYDGTIGFVDECIGSILQALKDAGHHEDTLVVFAADHGEELYERHAYFYHSNSFYRSCVQIPFVFAQPGRVEAQTRDDLVENVDLTPTVLAWLGVDAGANDFRGRDLSGVLEGKGAVARDFAVAQWEDEIYAIRNRDWLFVDNQNDVMPFAPPYGGRYPVARFELYDLRADPREQVNVLAQNKEQAKKMSAVLEEFLAGLVTNVADEDLSPDHLKELEQQGYVGGLPQAKRTKKGRTRPNFDAVTPPPTNPDEPDTSDGKKR